MTYPEYLDFDLELVQDDTGYVARVLGSPKGEAEAHVVLPFDDDRLENVVLKLGRTRSGVRKLGSPQQSLAKSFGASLYDAVFAGEVGMCFRRSIDEADRQGKGLRLRLRLNDAPALSNVPWEYLYPESLGHFLVLSLGTPVVRYLDLPREVAPLAVEPPLRLLLVVSGPSDLASLDATLEVGNLRGALVELTDRGLVQLDVLAQPTLAALRKALRTSTYHVLHFIGHGGYDEAATDGVLAFEDDTGRSHRVSGGDLGTMLHDHKTLRLVVLNACEGARTSPEDPFSGVAQSLVQQGLPAVVAMQFEVTDEAAIALSHEFYAALSDGYPVDAALTEGRKAVFGSDNDVEWGTPVLYLRAKDGRIFDVTPTTRIPVVTPSTPPADVPPNAEAPVVKELVVEEERPQPQPPAVVVPSAARVVEPPTPPPAPAQPVAPPPVPVQLVAPPPAAEQVAPRQPYAPPNYPQQAYPAQPPIPPGYPSPRAPSPPGPPPRRRGRVLLIVVAVIAAGFFGLVGLGLLVGTSTGSGGGAEPTGQAGPVVVPTDEPTDGPTDQPTPSAADFIAPQGTPLLDGNPGEWSGIQPIESGAVVFGKDTGVRAEWRLVWDASALYLLALVTDPSIVQPNEADPSQLWRGDSVHLELGPDAGTRDPSKGPRSTDKHFLFGPTPEGFVLMCVNPRSGGSFGRGQPDPAVQAWLFPTATGYGIEAGIPWTSTGISAPSPGTVVSLNLNASDGSPTGELISMVSSNPRRTDQNHPGTWQRLELT